MTKTFTLSSEEVDSEQKTITVSETKQVTTESRTSVAQLKTEHAQILSQIEGLKGLADAVVDQLTDINDNAAIDITVSNIPTKLSK